MNRDGWSFVLAALVSAPIWLWAMRLVLRRNRMTPDEARAAVRRRLGGAECVHIGPADYPIPPLEVIRIATLERAYVYAGTSRSGMAFRRGDIALAQLAAHAGEPGPHLPIGPVRGGRRYARGAFGNLKQHGWWPYNRRRRTGRSAA